MKQILLRNLCENVHPQKLRFFDCEIFRSEYCGYRSSNVLHHTEIRNTRDSRRKACGTNEQDPILIHKRYRNFYSAAFIFLTLSVSSLACGLYVEREKK